MQVMTHPLDRSIAFAFFVTIFFTILALVTGLPVVLVLMLLLPIGWFVKWLLSCRCVQAMHASRRSSSWTSRIQGVNHLLSTASAASTASSPSVERRSVLLNPNAPAGVAGASSSSRRRSRRPASAAAPLVPLTPLESFHLSDECRNNHRYGVCNVLLFFDKSLRLEQLKDMIASRILRKPEFARFSSRIVFRGECFFLPFPLNDFACERRSFLSCCCCRCCLRTTRMREGS